MDILKRWYVRIYKFFLNLLKTFIRLNVNPLKSNALKCVSMSNQECKVRAVIMNINRNKPLFYPYSILVNKCSGSCNNINDPYAKLFVPDVAKDMNIKVFNLM